ncbi:hypothetical protein PS2_014050 [Malus domestica]
MSVLMLAFIGAHMAGMFCIWVISDQNYFNLYQSEHEVKAENQQLISGTECRSGAVHWKRIVDLTVIMFLTYGLAIPQVVMWFSWSTSYSFVWLSHSSWGL